MISTFGMGTAFLAVGGHYYRYYKFTAGINLSGWASLSVLIMFLAGSTFVLGVIGNISVIFLMRSKTGPHSLSRKPWELNTQKAFSQIERFLFVTLLVLQFLFFGSLINGHRIPAGHDGLHYFTLQYFFLNNAAIYGEVPQWIPFMTHGSIATWWYSVLGVCGIWANMLLQCGPLIKNMNFLNIYYAGMFMDELVLLVGTWLLGRRFFSSPLTVFFVCISVMGSSIWATQPYFNFYHFYTLFLAIIHFIHRFLDEGEVALSSFCRQFIYGPTDWKFDLRFADHEHGHFIFFVLWTSPRKPFIHKALSLEFNWKFLLCFVFSGFFSGSGLSLP